MKVYFTYIFILHTYSDASSTLCYQTLRLSSPVNISRNTGLKFAYLLLCKCQTTSYLHRWLSDPKLILASDIKVRYFQFTTTQTNLDTRASFFQRYLRRSTVRRLIGSLIRFFGRCILSYSWHMPQPAKSGRFYPRMNVDPDYNLLEI